MEIFLLTCLFVYGIIHIKHIASAIVGVLACIFMMLYSIAVDTLYLVFNIFGVIKEVKNVQPGNK